VRSGYRGPFCGTGCQNVKKPDMAPDSSCKVANGQSRVFRLTKRDKVADCDWLFCFLLLVKLVELVTFVSRILKVPGWNFVRDID
jgi:hypothetical protein